MAGACVSAMNVESKYLFFFFEDGFKRVSVYQFLIFSPQKKCTNVLLFMCDLWAVRLTVAVFTGFAVAHQMALMSFLIMNHLQIGLVVASNCTRVYVCVCVCVCV